MSVASGKLWEGLALSQLFSIIIPPRNPTALPGGRCFSHFMDGDTRRLSHLPKASVLGYLCFFSVAEIKRSQQKRGLGRQGLFRLTVLGHTPSLQGSQVQELEKSVTPHPQSRAGRDRGACTPKYWACFSTLAQSRTQTQGMAAFSVGC